MPCLWLYLCSQENTFSIHVHQYFLRYSDPRQRARLLRDRQNKSKPRRSQNVLLWFSSWIRHSLPCAAQELRRKVYLHLPPPPQVQCVQTCWETWYPQSLHLLPGTCHSPKTATKNMYFLWGIQQWLKRLPTHSKWLFFGSLFHVGGQS